MEGKITYICVFTVFLFKFNYALYTKNDTENNIKVTQYEIGEIGEIDSDMINSQNISLNISPNQYHLQKNAEMNIFRARRSSDETENKTFKKLFSVKNRKQKNNKEEEKLKKIHKKASKKIKNKKNTKQAMYKNNKRSKKNNKQNKIGKKNRKGKKARKNNKGNKSKKGKKEISKKLDKKSKKNGKGEDKKKKNDKEEDTKKKNDKEEDTKKKNEKEEDTKKKNDKKEDAKKKNDKRIKASKVAASAYYICSGINDITEPTEIALTKESPSVVLGTIENTDGAICQYKISTRTGQQIKFYDTTKQEECAQCRREGFNIICDFNYDNSDDVSCTNKKESFCLVTIEKIPTFISEDLAWVISAVGAIFG